MDSMRIVGLAFGVLGFLAVCATQVMTIRRKASQLAAEEITVLRDVGYFEHPVPETISQLKRRVWRRLSSETGLMAWTFAFMFVSIDLVLLLTRRITLWPDLPLATLISCAMVMLSVVYTVLPWITAYLIVRRTLAERVAG